MAYLSELHPEVYLVAPRPGGLANIVSPDDLTTSRLLSEASGSRYSRSIRSASGKASMRSITGRSSVRSYTGATSVRSMSASMRSSMASGLDSSFITSTPENPSREYRIKRVLFSSTWNMIDEEDDGPDPVPPPDPVVDVVTILSMCISTIMLMAAGYNQIPKDHLRWTLSYLQCVKDEYGNYPPNVRRLLNHIKMLDDSLESFQETEIREGGMLEGDIDPTIQEQPADVGEVAPAQEGQAAQTEAQE